MRSQAPRVWASAKMPGAMIPTRLVRLTNLAYVIWVPINSVPSALEPVRSTVASDAPSKSTLVRSLFRNSALVNVTPVTVAFERLQWPIRTMQLIPKS